jgi:hypothetical protein
MLLQLAAQDIGHLPYIEQCHLRPVDDLTQSRVVTLLLR